MKINYLLNIIKTRFTTTKMITQAYLLLFERDKSLSIPDFIITHVGNKTMQSLQ